MKVHFSLIVFLILLGCTPKEGADLVLLGKVITVNQAFDIQEAIAIKGSKIVFVGSKDAAQAHIGNNTKVIDKKDNFIMPGMHDAHCHPYGLGNDEEGEWFSVKAAHNFDQMVALIADKAKKVKPGDWIIGGGWNQERWPGKQLPIHDAVSAVTPDNPLFLYRQGGNSAFVNAKALEIAGITKDTPDPFGGKIYRKDNGEPTGFLTNMGNNMVHKHFPKKEKPLEWYIEKYEGAQKICHEAGLTGWTDAGVYPDHISYYKAMVDQNRLKMRSNVMLQNPREGDLEQHFKENRFLNYGGEEMLQVRSIKMYYDGALGSRGAAFFDPYLDDPMDPENRGNTEVPISHVYEVAKAALKTGMQVCPHAIGIRGNSEILEGFEKALKENPVKDHRFRSEHAEVVRPSEITKMVELGVIPSVQPIHCTSDMGFMHSRIGAPRSKESASPWRNMIEAGLEPANGSDFAVESHKPLWGIYAAITRQDHKGFPAGGWYGDQRMTREEAIKGYTIWAAKAAFWEDVTGSLEVGKAADVVVLNTDLLNCEPKAIIDAQVLYTIVNGEMVYEKS
jgi:predicted amidohydrolase YtcJ